MMKKKEESRDEIFTTFEAAKYLNITEQSLRQYRYKNKPKIPYIKDDITRRVFYEKSSLDKHIMSVRYPAGNFKTPKQIYQELGITVEKFWRFAVKLEDKLERKKIRNKVYFAENTVDIMRRELMQ
jgi:hypothetical protein